MGFRLFSREVTKQRPVLVNMANVVRAEQGSSATKPIDDTCVLFVLANGEAIYVDGTLESVAAALTEEPEAQAPRLVRLEDIDEQIIYVDPSQVTRIHRSGMNSTTTIWVKDNPSLVAGTPDEVARALGLSPKGERDG